MMKTPIQIHSFHHQQGAILIAILGVLLLIFIISGSLTDSVLTQHKTNSAFKSQIQAESLSQYALTSTEEDILQLADRPKTIDTATAIKLDENQLVNHKVWQNSLDNYQLKTTSDVITGETLDWTRQPESWWQTYANKYIRNLSATSSQTAYSIVEEYKEDFSGNDLGQARNHFSGPSKVLYQVTALGTSGTQSASRVRTIVAKTFL